MLDDPPPTIERSRLMSRVRDKDTAPEMAVRRMLHAAGYRYRLHVRQLPGRPDLVFPARRKLLFVHGCFWHRHPGCARTTMPKTRAEFWKLKFDSNIERDCRKEAALRAMGWQSMIVWECEAKSASGLLDRLKAFLGSPGE